MKDKLFRRTFMVLMLCFAVVVTGGLMIGCSGSDGSAGATGATGPAGPITETGESCNTCHTTNRIADIADYHPTVTNQLKISNIQVSSSVTGTPVVTFHVDTINNTTGAVLASYATMTYSQLRVYIADLVPAGAVTSPTGTSVPNLEGTLSTPYFEQWAYDNGKAFTNNGSGNYSYTMSTVWGSPTNTWFNVADIDVTPTTGHTQRIVLRAAPLSGDISFYGTANTGDFKVPADGTSATMLADQRLLTTIDTCQKCHSTKMLGAAHGSGYMDTKACVICHSPLYATTNDPAGFMAEINADLPNFIHQIHAAIPNPDFATWIW